MRRPSPRRRLRGTTLIEMMIVLVVAFIITALALGALLEVKRVQDEASVRNQMFRDVQLAMDQLGYDFGYFGLAVPNGLAAQGSLSASFPNQLRPVLRRAKASNFVFVGDLPYPNAELPGVTLVQGMNESGNLHKFSVTSEISPCVPARSGAGAAYNCDPEDAQSINASRVPSDYTGADACTESNMWGPVGRLCPWGQNKWQGGSDGRATLVVGAPSGQWYTVKWPRVTSSSSSNEEDIGNGIGLHLFHDYPASNEHNLPPTDILDSNGSGTAFAAVLDRVFYVVESGTLYRRQCWGAVIGGGVDPASASWPSVGDGVIGTSTTPPFCAAPNDGTGWEPVVNNVQTLTMTYIDRDDTVIDVTAYTPEEAASVRVVEVTIVLRRDNTPAVGRSVSNTLTRRFQLKNANGIVGAPAVAGGCDGVTCQ